MASSPDHPNVPPEQIFLAHMRLIDRVIEHSVRRYHFRREEVEDFTSTVKIKLIEDNYEVLRQHRGQSSLATYLSVVIKRALLDYLNHLWGKWRPSAEAERLGETAVWLEELLVREGYSFEEACQILRLNRKLDVSVQELAELAVRLPVRLPRKKEDEEWLSLLESGDHADDRALERERAARRQEILTALREALSDLPSEDRVIIELKRKGVRVVRMAPMVKVEQMELYRRINKIQVTLRKALETRGIRREEIDEIFRDGP